VSRTDNAPRHALDCELTTQLPDDRVRAAMAAFYKHSEGYAEQQGSHRSEYFHRLLGVMEAVLTKPEIRLLEIGAGSAGAMRAFLATRPGARAVAMELSSASLLDAGKSGTARLRAVAGNALQLPFRDRSLDAVVAFEVIEHLPDVAHALEEALRVVRRPGYIIVGLPNHASLWTPLEDRLRGRQRLAFGIDRGRGAWRWWKRNAALAWRKRLSGDAEFLYREPILNEAAGGDADAVYYAAPIDLLRFFRRRRTELVTTSAHVRLGWAARFLPVELQGSTVMAWRVTDATG
jgi:SAM-dependent methyltransferase